jgi:exopolysaccharide production protein ExoQ
MRLPRSTFKPPQRSAQTADRGGVGPRPGMKPWPGDRGFSSLVVAMLWTVYATTVVSWDWMKNTIRVDQPIAGEGFAPNPALRLAKLLLLVISVSIAFSRRAVAMRTLRETNRFFLAFLVIVPVSAIWSIAPGQTIARFISILSLVSVCFALTMTDWYRERVQHILRPLLTAVCVGSILVGIYKPNWIIEGGLLGQAWHGLLEQKNGFGQVAGLALILWLHGVLTREVKMWQAVIGFGASGGCLYLSRSSTSLLAAVFVICLMLMLLKSPNTLRRSMKYFISLFASVVILYAMAVLKIIPALDILLKPVTMITGKDTTFSNRSMIWEIIKEHMARWPNLGAGYGAYWIGPDPSSPSYEFIGRMYFYPFQSHNGYLEMVNDLGYIGLVILLGYLIVFVKQGIRLLALDRSMGSLCLCLFFHQCVINLSESTWLRVDVPVGMATMTLATFAMARTLSESRRTGMPPPRRKDLGKA